MSFHYGLILSTKKCCGVPLAYSPSGTGKTMSLRCGLALFGAHNQHIFQQGILQFFANRCSESTGIDDPSYTNDLAELLLSVTKRANITRGTNKPQSSPIVAANFLPSGQGISLKANMCNLTDLLPQYICLLLYMCTYHFDQVQQQNSAVTTTS